MSVWALRAPNEDKDSVTHGACGVQNQDDCHVCALSHKASRRCLEPPLSTIPKGEWMCALCQADGADPVHPTPYTLHPTP